MADWSELVARTMGDGSPLAVAAPPLFDPPWDDLAKRSGWVFWCGHPPVPPLGDAAPLPAPPELLWDDPMTGLATATAIALDYATRRGAADRAAIQQVLRREGPLAVVVPGEVHESLLSALQEIAALGIPLIFGLDDLLPALAALPVFAARSTAHAAAVSRRHDPALSFQSITAVDHLGGNPLSSFVLHAEGERDGVTVIGAPSVRVGLEIGVRGPGIDLERTVALERAAASYPGFLDGVSSRLEGHSLEIEWAAAAEPSPSDLGETLRAWLMALDGADLVDVRLVFAPPVGRSAVLTEMRARAAAFKEYRLATLDRHHESLTGVDKH